MLQDIALSFFCARSSAVRDNLVQTLHVYNRTKAPKATNMNEFFLNDLA